MSKLKMLLMPGLLLLLISNLSAQAPCFVSAGPDQTVCKNQAFIPLFGSTNDAAVWTTAGDGYFDDPAIEKPNYFPGPSDYSTGKVTLTITNAGTGCTGGAVTDQIIVNFISSPLLEVSTVKNLLCQTQAITEGISLFGYGTSVGSFDWSSSGSGSFIDPTNINTVYSPTSADIAMGAVTLKATATGTNGCVTISSVDVKFIVPTTFQTDPDVTICSSTLLSNSSILLSVSSPTSLMDSIRWSAAGQGALYVNDSYSAYYYPTSAEIASPTLGFTATAYWSDNCGVATDDFRYFIDQSPTLEVGLDRNICKGTVSMPLSVTTNATSVTWATTGAGFIANPNAVNTVYNFTAAEQASVNYYSFSVSTPAVGVCPALTDYFSVYTIDAPYVYVSVPSAPTCQLQNVLLDGYQGYGVDAVLWSTNGTGSFLDQNKVAATYIPSAADRLSGSTTVTLTGTGVCPAVSQSGVITYNNSLNMAVTAGGPYAIGCKDTPMSLSGAQNNVTGATWSKINGNGSFSSVTNLNTVYTPDAWEPEPVKVVLSAIDANCGVVSDTVILTFADAPSPGVLSDFGSCAGDTIYLSAFLNVQQVSWSASGGAGNFVNGIKDDPSGTKYMPGATDASVAFTVTVTGLPGCGVRTLNQKTIIHAKPVSIAGSDAFVCMPATTYTLGANTPAPQLGSNGFRNTWYQVGNAPGNERINKTAAPTAMAPQGGVPFVKFSDPSKPNDQISFVGRDTFKLVWRVEETWPDMSSQGCLSLDTVAVIYMPYAWPDTLTAPAGLQASVNVLANDSLQGYSYTIALDDDGYVSGNLVTLNTTTGVLSYLNKSSLINGRDTVKYTVTVSGCAPLLTPVVVKLKNGPPVVADTSVTLTTVQKQNDVITTVPLNLNLVFIDYNYNLDWSTISVPKGTSNGGANITFDPIDPWMVTVTYSSNRAQAFVGIDAITFKVCDALGFCYDGIYRIDLLPDYSSPAVKASDFVVINAVSANGDGVNDFMYIYGVGDYKNFVTIYNRWNQKVWEGENYDNNLVKFEGIGNVSGLTGPLPEGSYFYVIKNLNPDQNDEKKGLYSGYLELRR